MKIKLVLIGFLAPKSKLRIGKSVVTQLQSRPIRPDESL